jgi:hemolysin III
MIFVLIAATYTPICLIPLRGPGLVPVRGHLGLALAGIVMKLFWLHAPRRLSTAVYLVMGWLCLVAVWPMIQTLPAGALVWLALGGAFYSAGGAVYALKRPNLWPRVLGFHELFHLLVLCGSLAHYRVMYGYVAHLG